MHDPAGVTEELQADVTHPDPPIDAILDNIERLAIARILALQHDLDLETQRDHPAHHASILTGLLIETGAHLATIHQARTK